MRGVKYSAKEKWQALEMWLVDKVDILKVIKRFKCTERSLWRWKAKFDGTLESLQNKKPQPLHPNSHTAEEIDAIEAVFNENPNITYSEAFGILRTEYAYSRTYGGFYNFILRNNIRPHKKKERRVNMPYDTPDMFGEKMQMDVKFVPRKCNKGEFPDEWYYQYTMIDEATRERFMFPYKEHCVTSTIDFVQRAIVFFGYIPNCIQTDNGLEFTNPKHAKRVHAFDQMCEKLGIKHQLIKPRTPRLNGKVERSHRSDQEGFYNYLTFKTFEELIEEMRKWNIRYNNRPHSQLKDKYGKKRWQSPNDKRRELQEMLEEGEIGGVVRFLRLKPRPVI